jgi:hypothetical protein
MPRLLLTVEVLDFVERLPRAEQQRLWKRFREIGEHPRRYSEFTSKDATGRLLDANLCGDFSITYWDDAADQHVKILDISPADS